MPPLGRGHAAARTSSDITFNSGKLLMSRTGRRLPAGLQPRGPARPDPVALRVLAVFFLHNRQHGSRRKIDMTRIVGPGRGRKCCYIYEGTGYRACQLATTSFGCTGTTRRPAEPVPAPTRGSAAADQRAPPAGPGRAAGFLASSGADTHAALEPGVKLLEDRAARVGAGAAPTGEET